MKLSRFIITLSEPLDLDLQLMATEMDTSAKRIKYISADILPDMVAMEGYDAMIDDIETNCPEVLSFDDNTVMYEFLNEPIIIHSALGNKYVLFDSSVAYKFERKMLSYKKSGN